MAADPEVVAVTVKLLHGIDGAVVVVPARMCAWLNRYALAEWRNHHPGPVHPEIAGLMSAVGLAARSLRLDDNTTPTSPVHVDKDWLTTTAAAVILRITDRGVRKAIAEQRLSAELHGGRWMISRGDIALFRRSRRTV